MWQHRPVEVLFDYDFTAQGHEQDVVEVQIEKMILGGVCLSLSSLF
jgi:hypothetical protein